jgi:hypothetical protein
MGHQLKVKKAKKHLGELFQDQVTGAESPLRIKRLDPNKKAC